MASVPLRRATNAAKCWPRFAGHGEICRKRTARNCAAMESREQTAHATGAVWTSPESVLVLAGAQIRVECGVGSRTQQITRKRSYKTLDLRRHKSLMAITPPRRRFCAITRREIACSAKPQGTPPICWCANAREFSKSFGGRLAQVRATEASDLERRAWSSAEELNRGKESDLGGAPLQAQSINALPLPAHGFRAGRGRGEWGQVVFGKAVR
jgi:hypothetical protein